LRLCRVLCCPGVAHTAPNALGLDTRLWEAGRAKSDVGAETAFSAHVDRQPREINVGGARVRLADGQKVVMTPSSLPGSSPPRTTLTITSATQTSPCAAPSAATSDRSSLKPPVRLTGRSCDTFGRVDRGLENSPSGASARCCAQFGGLGLDRPSHDAEIVDDPGVGDQAKAQIAANRLDGDSQRMLAADLGQ
jgi:hypothetical protein